MSAQIPPGTILLDGHDAHGRGARGNQADNNKLDSGAVYLIR